MHDAQRITKNTLVLYLKMAITVFISLYTTRKLLSILGSNDFGLFNLVAGIITLLTFFNGAMSMASQRFISYYKGSADQDKQSSVFTISFVMHIVIALFILIILELSGDWIVNKFLKIDIARITSAKKVFHLSAITTFLSIVSVPYEALITANENMIFFAVIGVLETILKLLAVFFLDFFKDYDSLVVYGISMPIIYFVLLVIKMCYCKNKYPETIVRWRFFNNDIFIEMGVFAFWSFLGTATSMFANYGQGLLLNRFFGTVINAAQSITAQLSGQLGAFASTMQRAINPYIDKSEGAGERHAMLAASMLGCRFSFFLLLVFYIPFFFKMDYLLRLWLVNIPAFTVVFCKLLFLRNLVEQLYTSLTNSIGAVGVIKRFQIANSLLSLLPLLLGYFLFLHKFPPSSLYVVFILYAIVQGCLVVYYTKSLCGLDIIDYAKQVLLKCALTFLIPFSCSYILHIVFRNESVFNLIVYCILSFFVTIVSVWFLGLTAKNRLFFHSYSMSLLSKLNFTAHEKGN